MLGRGCPRALSGPPGSALHLRLEDSSSGVAGLGTRETGWWRLSAAVSLELEAAQTSLLCLSWDLTLQTWPPACRAPPWPKPGLQEDQSSPASWERAPANTNQSLWQERPVSGQCPSLAQVMMWDKERTRFLSLLLEMLQPSVPV